MHSLHDLSKISAYRAESGYMHDVLVLSKEGLSISQALERWKAMGRTPNSFYKTRSLLKYKLLDSAFLGFAKIAPLETKRMDVWDDYRLVRKLLIARQKRLAIEQANKTINDAAKCGFVEIVRDLAGQLEHYYGTMDPNTRKYLRYRKMRKVASAQHNQQEQALALFSRMVFLLNKRKDVSELEAQIDELREVKDGSYAFMLFRCDILFQWDLKHKKYESIFPMVKSTIRYFDRSDKSYPDIIKTNLYRKALPLLIGRGRFSVAGSYISKAIESVRVKGSRAWHLIMFQRAYLGFWSGKSKIVQDTLIQVRKVKKEENSEMVYEMWLVMEAYLKLLEGEGRFKLSKFMNSIPVISQDKDGVNIAILIVQLLHLLKSGDKKRYMNVTEQLSGYSHRYLRGPKNARARCIFKLLRCVEDGDYHLARVEARSRKYLRELHRHPSEVVTDAEPLPYEKVWELVLSYLK